MSGLSEEKKKDFRHAFNMFDKDNSGYINTRELLTVMRAFKQDPTKAEVQQLMKRLDTDGNGKIEYEEFEKYMVENYKHPEEFQNSMMDAFKLFDKDGSGKIDAEELKEAMMKLGDKLSQEEAEDMIKTADLDKDGKIDYEEFVRMMQD
ncbi:calmodulin-beta-like isoform X1 [Saccostrea cucullata]|uniref:calmodulin-beta-like isoform X1 n=2 Tax=Saccostrea cuccullata TaxID=36930 RepID=UPI002ED0DDAC